MKTQLQELLEELNINKSEFLKIKKAVDETYFNLCNFSLYWDAYTKLQNISSNLENLVNNEYVYEEDFQDIIFLFWTYLSY